MLIILQQRHAIKSAQQVDQIVSAEIPQSPESITDLDSAVQQQKRDQARKLQELVLKNMVHGPCGAEKPHAPCMHNSQGDVTQHCQKKFPKQYMNETVWDEKQSYATYRRRRPDNGGVEMQRNNRLLNNSWVVPYNPYLLLRYNCHINVEICASTKATKYLYKYIHKGGDRMMMRVYEDGEQISRNE